MYFPFQFINISKFKIFDLKVKKGTHQVGEELPQLVFLIRGNGVDVVEEQLVSIAYLLERNEDDRLGDQCRLRVLKKYPEVVVRLRFTVFGKKN
jgi:hypothetical protein